MSYSKDVYVGVYIECKNELLSKFKKVKICQSKCNNDEYPIKMNFCPNCGKLLQENEIPNGTRWKINLEIPEELEDVMRDVNQQGLKMDSDIYISNSSLGQMYSIGECEIETYPIYVNKLPENVTPIHLKFIEDFLSNKQCYEFLQLCMDIYGSENVDLKFGTIVYYK